LVYSLKSGGEVTPQIPNGKLNGVHLSANKITPDENSMLSSKRDVKTSFTDEPHKKAKTLAPTRLDEASKTHVKVIQDKPKPVGKPAQHPLFGNSALTAPTMNWYNGSQLEKRRPDNEDAQSQEKMGGAGKKEIFLKNIRLGFYHMHSSLHKLKDLKQKLKYFEIPERLSGLQRSVSAEVSS
jgi:hypothetical protein